jgi:hypothetical protein
MLLLPPGRLFLRADSKDELPAITIPYIEKERERERKRKKERERERERKRE